MSECKDIRFPEETGAQPDKIKETEALKAFSPVISDTETPLFETADKLSELPFIPLDAIPNPEEDGSALLAPPKPAVSKAKTMWSRLIWVLFAAYLLLCLANLFESWMFHHQGWNGARRSVQANNLIRYGYFDTKLKPMDNVGRFDNADGQPKRPSYYWHHPPGAAVYLSIAYQIIGYGEPQARLVAALFSCLTFLLLWGAFRRAGGERTAFFVLLFYTFAPIMATYLNLVNYETFIFFSMAAVLYGWERFRETERFRWFALMIFGVFFGTLTDYPILPFFFYFFLFMAAEVAGKLKGPGSFFKKSWPAIVFPLSVLAATGLMVLIMSSWGEPLRSYKGIADGRANMSGDPVESIMGKWNWYIDFLSPFLYGVAAFYLLDFLPRLFGKKLRRLDAYMLIYAGCAATYLIPLKEALIHHEYGALYFVAPLAIAGGIGLDEITRMMSRGKTWVAEVLALLLIVPFLIFTVPRIHSKHVSPAFEYVKPIYQQASDLNNQFAAHNKPLGQIVQEFSNPDEEILLRGTGKHPALWYYFDRRFEEQDDADKLEKMVKDNRFRLLTLNLFRAPYTLQAPLIREKAHVRYLRYGVFDLKGGRIPHTEVRVLDKKPMSDILRYFYSHVETPWDLVTDHYRSLDYALKLDRAADADYHLAKIQDGATVYDPLHKALAEYNLDQLRKGKTDFSPVKNYLDAGKKDIKFPSGIEMVGFRLLPEADGRTLATVVFKPHRPITANYQLTSEMRCESKRRKVRDTIGSVRKEWPFDVPTSMWKPGLLYTAEFYLEAPMELYRFSVSMAYYDSIAIQNPADKSFDFQLSANLLADEQFPKLGELTQSIVEGEGPQTAEEWKALGVGANHWKNGLEVGQKFKIRSVLVVSEGKNKGWQGRMVVEALAGETEEYRWNLNLDSCKPNLTLPQKGKKIAAGETQVLNFTLNKECDPRLKPIALEVLAPKFPSQDKDQILMTADMGIRFPFHSLVRYDTYRLIKK